MAKKEVLYMLGWGLISAPVIAQLSFVGCLVVGLAWGAIGAYAYGYLEDRGIL